MTTSLWCVGEDGFVEDVEIAGLGIDGADLLSIAGNAGVLVRSATSTIVRIDWKTAAIVDPDAATVDAGTPLEMSASVDLIWIDETEGNRVWAVHPWGINVIEKDSSTGVLIGESGEVIDEGESDEAPTGPPTDQAVVQEEHEPDDNGIDDPPVAVDDPVTARAGAAIPIAVTANDYDPDGEAIALSGVGEAAHGTVDIQNATTVSYLPKDNYLGVDQFDYTIVDGDGTEDSATVTIELLPVDTVNRAPIGSPDVADTAADNAGRHRRADQRHRPGTRCTANRHLHRAGHRRHGDRDAGTIGTARAPLRAPARRVGHGDVHVPTRRLVRCHR